MYVKLISNGLKSVPNQKCKGHLTGKFTKITGMLSPGISAHFPRAFVVMRSGPEQWANRPVDCIAEL